MNVKKAEGKSEEKPMITTIIPTYRRPDMLRRAIKSVLNQTYRNLQVCVYDDASGDETASVVAELQKEDSRVKYFYHPKNIGGDENYVYGMEHVDAPFFSFLADDDVLLPNFYQLAMENFNKYPDAMLFAGTTIPMSNDGRILNRPFPSSWRRYGYYVEPTGMEEMLNGGTNKHLIWNSVLFRTDIINQIGGLDVETSPPSDSDFILRTAAHFPIVVSEEPCAIVVGHHNSLGEETSQLSVYRGWLKILEKIMNNEQLPFGISTFATHMLLEQLEQRLFWFGIAAVIRKNFDDAEEMAKILNNVYDLRTRSFVLHTMAKTCKHSGFLHSLLVYLNKIRVSRIQRNFQETEGKRFERYVKYLEMKK